jgi:TolB protein
MSRFFYPIKTIAVIKLVLCTCLALFSTYSYSQDSSAFKRSKRVTNVVDSYPMLSPDGKRISFQSNRTGDWEIFVMNTDGSNLLQLTQVAGFDGGPVWSPDGKKIVFPSERDGDPEIYVMDADGSNQKRLTTTPGDDSHPHWYPDGSRIIFNSARTSPDIKAPWGMQWHEVFSMKIDGSDVKQVSSFKTVSTYPSVSPDGKKIAFRRVIDGPAFNWDLSSNANNRNSEVFVMDTHGKNAVNLSQSPAFDGWPCWSPDSKRICFSSNRNGPANVGQLYVVAVDGSGLQKVFDFHGSLTQPAWSKDGKSIYAYQAFEGPDYEFGNIVAVELNEN